MARINLSVPDELKADMDSMGLNWSAIAQKAFTDAIKIEKLRSTNMNQAAGIERLRVGKLSNADRAKAEGHRLGTEWALHRAEYDELERVAAMRESIGGEWCAPGAAHHLAQAINENQMEAETLQNVFQDMREHELTDDLIEGFIEGAAETFDEV